MECRVGFHRTQVLPLTAGIPGFFQQLSSSRSSAVFTGIDHASRCLKRVVADTEAELANHQGTTVSIEGHYVDPVDGFKHQTVEGLTIARIAQGVDAFFKQHQTRLFIT